MDRIAKLETAYHANDDWPQPVRLRSAILAAYSKLHHRTGNYYACYVTFSEGFKIPLRKIRSYKDLETRVYKHLMNNYETHEERIAVLTLLAG